MSEIPACFYRVSVKALILNDTKDKLLLVREAAGSWELPGGGLEWGATPHEELAREVQEEMGLEVTNIAAEPAYFLGGFEVPEYKVWIVNLVYEATVAHLHFKPSPECVEIRFVNESDTAGLDLRPQVRELLEKINFLDHQ